MEKLCRTKNSKNWRCGEIVFNGTSLCKKHYDLNQERNARRSMKKRKKQETEEGISDKGCRIKNSKKWRCGKAVFNGTSFCKRHYDLNQERNVRRNMRRKRQECGGSLSEKLDGIRESHVGRGRPKLSETEANPVRIRPEKVDNNAKVGIEKNQTSDESTFELGENRLKKQRLEESYMREGTASLNCETKKHDSNNMGQPRSPRCHMCLRNEEVDLMYCSNCKKKWYCYDCLTKWYTGNTFEEFQSKCPFCRGTCNCIACLSGDFDMEGTSSALWRIIRCHYEGVFHMQEGQVYNDKGGCYIDAPRWGGDDINYMTLRCWILDNLPISKVPLMDIYWFHGEEKKVIETEEDLSYMWSNASIDDEGKTHIYVQYIQPTAVEKYDCQTSNQIRELTPETPGTQASKKRERESTEEEPNSLDTEELGGIARGRLDEEMKAWCNNHPHGFEAKPETAADGSLNLMVWQCKIPGKVGTDWVEGYFPLTLHFSEDYPSKPPKCNFPLGFIHPSICPSGSVCLSILDEDSGWRPAITVEQILVGLQDLLNQPNSNYPAQGDGLEAGHCGVQES